MAQESFIICDNLVKVYKVAGHDVVALQGLDVVVGAGELLGVVGVSGSGKSTLMNILGGLDRPTAGRVWVNGKDLLKLTDAGLNRYRLDSVGFVWQQSSRNLIPYLNAQENVEYPMTLAGWFGAKKRKQALKLLESVGLKDRRHHRLSELSGGEQQRVAIAVALANNPKLLLADEPTGEIDGKNAQIVYDIFRSLNREFGLTTLIVSHDPNLAHQVNRVINIRDGKISTETTWKLEDVAIRTTEGDQENNKQEKVLQELTVVDSAGRLQVPKDYLEKMNIKGRVRLELIEQGILIHPVVLETQAEDISTLVDQFEQTKKANLLQKTLWRIRSLRGGPHVRKN